MSGEDVLDTTETTCCIAGAGPGGMILALLLARRGVPVTLLEAHPTFERDFRGDTLHPSTLEILDQIGLADALHRLPHVKMYGAPPQVASMLGVALFDFRRDLKTRFPYILWMAQERFLDFLAGYARTLPTFRLVMGASVQRLVVEDGRVRGVRYRSADGWHEVRAPLTTLFEFFEGMSQERYLGWHPDHKAFRWTVGQGVRPGHRISLHGP